MHLILGYFYSTNIYILYGGSAFLLLTFVYFLWKTTFGKIAVNCWFCNTDTVVAYHQKNKWSCKQCSQYNGFNKHGDYNKTLPEMYDERLNIRQIASSATDDVENEIPQRVKLCEKCSRYQTLKYKQLAQFQPLVENNFAAEVDAYKRKLEKLYQVCRGCIEASQRYIKLQDTILRGRMMPQIKKLGKCQNNIMRIPDTFDIMPTESKCQKCYAVLLQFVMLILSSLYSVWTLYNYFPNYLKLNLSYFSLYGVNFFANFSAFIITNGLALSVIFACFKGISKIRSARFYVVFWLLCGALMITTQHRSYDNKHVQDLINFYSSKIGFKDPISNLENSNQTAFFSPVVYYMLHFVLCTIMIIVCMINIVLSMFFAAPTLAKSIEQNRSAAKRLKIDRVSKSAPEADVASLTLDDDLYSDDNVSVDETKTNEVNTYDGNSDVTDHSLNGSLNALKLQDNDQFFNNEFKNPNTIFGGGSLPSSLHTPPPSRSSSLLSLASHNSGSAKPNFKLKSSFSSVNFARPSTELPFQRYKANSTAGCWTHSAAYAQSVVSSSKARLPRSNRANLVSELHKPLLSPARLPWLTKSRVNAASIGISENSVRKSRNLMKADSEGDVSVFDSVSQAGDGNYPELSDVDDELPRTPDHQRKTPSVNSSSPKSTLSNITSVTMKSVEEVENSRVCKWILAGCLFVNLVLVILLILEVKEIREMEHWKSKVSL